MGDAALPIPLLAPVREVYVNTQTDQRPDAKELPPVETSSGTWGKAQAQSVSAESLGRRVQRGFARALRILPKSMVKPFAAPYIAGERLEQAVARARKNYETDGLHSTLDVLGEDVGNAADVQQYHDEYRRLIQSIADLL